MSEREKLAPAIGLVRDRISGPPARRQAPTPTAEPSPTISIVPPEPAAEPTPAEARTKKTARPKASAASTGGMKRTTISISQSLARKMRASLQADRKITQIQFILNAIEANAHRLEQLVEAERPAPEPGVGLFPDQSQGRAQVEERTTINFDTTEANLKVIDALVEKSGAASRSELIRAALRAKLSD